MLKIADNLKLPVDVVTQAIGIIAKRRAGKSYTMRRLAEQLLEAGQQVVLVDPKGDQWGIRSAADGKKPGFPIVILGGERGDVPLEVGSGEVVAKLVVEERVSVLIDLSMLRKHEVATFMTAFMENLYRLKAKEIYRTPVMLVIDEADAIAPQSPMKGEERMLGAAEDIVRRGGQRGIGCTLVTQRSAVLNKNVLTQVQVLVALRTIAPQDLKAIGAWIDVHGTAEQRATLMESLPSLPVGDAWFWSPGWPTTDGIFKRVHVSPISTFDSGATPKPGEKRVEPKNLADVDLNALTRQMAATIERAKADDPKVLKAKIAELERKLQAKPAAVVDQAAIAKEVNAAVAACNLDWARLVKERDGIIGSLKGRMGKAEQLLHVNGEAVVSPCPDFSPIAKIVRDATKRQENKPVSTKVPETRADYARSYAGDSTIGKGERIVLTAIAQHDRGVTRDQLGILTGYKRSTRDAYLQRLRLAGHIVDGSTITATEDGIAALGDFTPLPTGDDLREYWLNKLSGGEQRILAWVCGNYPAVVARDAIDEATGFKRSTRDAYLQRLNARRLVEVTSSGVKAADELFG